MFRAMAGFGRQHVLHERKFFELAGSQILKIEFIVTDDEARNLLAMVHQEKLRLILRPHPGAIRRDRSDHPSTSHTRIDLPN